MAFPVLPPKYYLAHFNELIEFLETHYEPVFEEAHRRFISDFRALSEDARCSYVRMVNRAGRVFEREGFRKYAEIEFVRPKIYSVPACARPIPGFPRTGSRT